MQVMAAAAVMGKAWNLVPWESYRVVRSVLKPGEKERQRAGAEDAPSHSPTAIQLLTNITKHQTPCAVHTAIKYEH
jgi:hypothetical protein